MGSCEFRVQELSSPALQKFSALLQPGHDAFLCEQYAAELTAILRRFSSAPGDPQTLLSALAPSVAFTPLQETNVEVLRIQSSIRAERVHFSSALANGRDAFLSSLSAYLRPFTKIETAELLITDLHILSKSPVSVEATVRWNLVGTLSGTANSAERQERTTTCTLSCQALNPGQWMIHRWLMSDESRVSVSGPAFVDITAHALSNDRELQRQFANGVDHWRSVIDAASGIDVYGNNGVAAGDFDGDGLDDLYICQPSGLPNRLLRNRGDGTFEDVTAQSDLGLLDGTASALFADFTNSGTQDLIVVRTSGPLLYLNQGGGRFELKPDAFRFAKPPSGTFTGVAAADYNRDGLLDVYFCLYAYYQGLSQYNHPRPYYDAQNGPPNFLMRNRGDGTFEDVTAPSGMNQNNNRFTFACGWCDFDNDGWPDLYVANDFGRKNFYRSNRDGTFTDVAHERGVEDYGAGMSVSWFDADNNGHQDLYVTDMYSAAGSRVTSQDAFLPGATPAIRKAYAKHARGNSLFINGEPKQQLSDASLSSGTGMGRWSWSGDAWDFDGDGLSDLYVTNGFISGEQQDDLASFFWRQIVARSLDNGSGALDYELAWNAINELIRSDHSWNGYERNIFFLNAGNRRFVEAAGAMGLDFRDDSRAFALADFDGDGRLEVVLKNRTGPQLRFLKNAFHSVGNSVAFRLQGTHSNRDAIGTVVTLHSGSLTQTKFIQAGSGFLSQHTKTLHFGVGDVTSPVAATIRWPSGGTQSFARIPVGHLIRIEEGKANFIAKPFGDCQTPEAAPWRTDSRSAQTVAESWLIEPLPAPNLPPDKKGRRLLLTLTTSGCADSQGQLNELSAAEREFQNAGIERLTIELDKAEPNVAGGYSILYRYLFDRRRPITTPLNLLIDRDGSIVKISAGKTSPHSILADFANIPSTVEARLEKALPFPGHYHAETPRRNFFTYGIAFVQHEYLDAALTCFERVVALDPNNAAAHYNIGTIYLNKQMLPEAHTSLERAVALDPNDVDALTNLGSVAGQLKEYDTAYRCFEAAVRLNPAHLIAMQNLVMLDRWKGRTDLAERHLERAIAASPNDPEFHFGLGMLFAGDNKFDAAQAELDRAVALRPSEPVTLNNLGVVLLRLQRPEQALQRFERCIKLAPDYDRPYLNIAAIYQSQGRVMEAQQLLKGYLARHPENSEVAEALKALSR